jgi:hypothetical protein
VHEHAPGKTKKPRVAKDEAEQRVGPLLEKDPTLSVREIHRITGVSTGSVAQTNAWQTNQVRLKAAEEEKDGSGAINTRRLTKTILDMRAGRDPDPAERVEVMDFLERKYIESATEEEKGRFYGLPRKQRDELLLLFGEQRCDDTAQGPRTVNC